MAEAACLVIEPGSLRHRILSLQERGSPCHQLSAPFVLGGVPFAFLGGYLAIDGAPYDTVLSVVLLLAAVRLVMPAEMEARGGSGGIGFLPCTLMGMGIGLVSGVVGIGGGVLLSPS